MKNFVTGLMLLFTILLTTQFVNHTYTRIFFTQKSILDKYYKKQKDITIESSLSLKELSMIYADAEKRIKIFERGKSRKKLSQYNKSDDPYYRKIRIAEIIKSRESDDRIIGEILFFWITGLFFIAGGSFAYMKFEKWAGAPAVASGFIMMILKTGPLIFITGASPDSSMVLNIKLIFTFITLGAVISYWFFTRKYIS